jgi:hypothetical protein
MCKKLKEDLKKNNEIQKKLQQRPPLIKSLFKYTSLEKSRILKKNHLQIFFSLYIYIKLNKSKA